MAWPTPTLRERRSEPAKLVAMNETTLGRPEPLNAAQQSVIDRLGKGGAEPLEFPAELAGELRAELESGLGPVVALHGDDRLVLSKGLLDGIHGCEARYLADSGDFRWTTASAKGVVAHKAIEISITRPTERVALDLIDEAIARFRSDEFGVGDFLARADDSTVDDVRAQANTYLAKFLEAWPPLSRRWRPVTEMSMRVELLDDQVLLTGKPDLTLGVPKGTQAGKVIVDFKTGGHSPGHRADLRFYALLDTLRLGTPPRLLATSYLDSARLEVEAVDDDLLFAEVRRVIDAGARYVALKGGDEEPRRNPGPPCRWCSLQDDCEPGQGYLADQADRW